MQNTTFNTTSLQKITDDTEFIIQCYHTMLGRSLEPFEMQHAIDMLSKGLSKKGFIYWITRSQEFDNRFVIEEIASYKLDCYLYKGTEKLLKLLHLDSIPKFNNDFFSAPLHCGRFGYLAEQFIEHDYSFNTEYSALAEGQISQISAYLPKLPDLTSVGHLASVLSPANSVLNTRITHIKAADITEYMKSHIYAPKSSCFITNPDVLFQLLTTERLSSFANSIGDTFVLTMPQLPSSHSYVSIVWDGSWDRMEFRPDGAICRWMSGPELDGSIHLINHSMDYCQITLNFILTVLDINSNVSISFHGKTIPIQYSGIKCNVTLKLFLNPGCNTMSLLYTGKRIKLPDASGRLALLSVDNLALSFTDSIFRSLSGEAAYSLDEQSHGTGYYPYLLPDSFIRSQLHRNGFFEISAIRVSKTYAVSQMPTTRYDYLRDERHHDCFYILDSDSIEEDIASFSSTILYIARRTGHLSPEFYNYELEEN